MCRSRSPQSLAGYRSRYSVGRRGLIRSCERPIQYSVPAGFLSSIKAFLLLGRAHAVYICKRSDRQECRFW